MRRIAWRALVRLSPLLILIAVACGRGGGEAAAIGRGDGAIAEAEPPRDGAVPVTLLYTNNVDGEIEPCG